MVHVAQSNRFAPGQKDVTLPLKPGKYEIISDFYEVDRKPFVGESATHYFNEYVHIYGKLINTVYSTRII